MNEAEFTFRQSFKVFNVNYTYMWNSQWSVNVDVEYADKGPEDYNINYLTFAIRPSWRMWKERRIFSIGPYYGYLYEYIKGGEVQNHPELKEIDFGVDAGVRLEFELYENLKAWVSPNVELGLYEFSFSKHIVYQLKTGVSIELKDRGDSYEKKNLVKRRRF